MNLHSKVDILVKQSSVQPREHFFHITGCLSIQSITPDSILAKLVCFFFIYQKKLGTMVKNLMVETK